MNDPIARRPVLIGVAAALGFGAIGGSAYELWGHHRQPRATGDLLAMLGSRDDANRVGSAFLAGTPAFDAGRATRELHHRMGRRPLAVVLAEDAAQARTTEIGGWVLPETLALLCALSAKAG